LQITDSNEKKEKLRGHKTIQKKEQVQLQTEVFANNYLKNQLGKVEELISQQQIQQPPKQ
jgi:hypothetical protein